MFESFTEVTLLITVSYYLCSYFLGTGISFVVFVSLNNAESDGLLKSFGISLIFTDPYFRNAGYSVPCGW